MFVHFSDAALTNPHYVSNLLQLASYEMCPKSSETGVIKTVLKNIEIYQSQIPSK